MKQAALVSLVRYANVGINWLVGILLARTLEVGDRGEYALVITFASLLNLVVTAGTDTATLRASGGTGVVTAVQVAIRQSKRAIWLGIPIAIALASTAIFADYKFPFEALAIAILSVPVMVLQQLLGNTLLGGGKIRVWATGSSLTILVYGTAALILAVMNLGSVASYTAAFGFGYLFASAIYLVVTRNWAIARVDRGTLDEIAKVRSAVYLPTMLQAILLRSQIIILQAVGEPSNVGHLSIALPFAELLLVVPIAISTILLPNLVSGRTLPGGKSGLYAFLFTFTAAAILAVAAQWMIPVLYGAEYAPSVAALWIILPSLPIFAYARIIQTEFYGKKNFRPVTIATILAIFASVCVQLVVSTVNPLHGAAAGVSAAYITLSVGLMVARSKER